MRGWPGRGGPPQRMRVVTTHDREVPCVVRRLRGRHWAARPAQQLRPGELVRQLRFDRLPPRTRLSLLLGVGDIAE